MPIDFLTEEHKQNYGRYAAEPNKVQLSCYFILDENDLTFIAQRRGDQHRLGMDPRSKLLQGGRMVSPTRPCLSSIRSPCKCSAYSRKSDSEVRFGWKTVAYGFNDNALVHIDHVGKYSTLTINSLEKLDETPSLIAINTQVRRLLACVICHEQHGEIRELYREGQEEHLELLGLITNATVLRNIERQSPPSLE